MSLLSSSNHMLGSHHASTSSRSFLTRFRQSWTAPLGGTFIMDKTWTQTDRLTQLTSYCIKHSGTSWEINFFKFRERIFIRVIVVQKWFDHSGRYIYSWTFFFAVYIARDFNLNFAKNPQIDSIIKFFISYYKAALNFAILRPIKSTCAIPTHLIYGV